MKEEYLFVYGTLAASVNREMNALVKKFGINLGDGFMTGKLFEVSGYPGFVHSAEEESRVYGDVYMLKEALQLFYHLDKYEECTPEFPEPWEYRRVQLPVQLNSGAVIHSCWVYEYNHATDKLEQIIPGDYRSYVGR
ncbi:gamma-glutamylcyclotransferase [Saccharicrinis sp. FJH54]|uniref:gamma-glutamylcyclotransferase family protein n=1 Tax=Saccharicrinis sp. FJH54 TaxID=3344665 RepID=UPI0035D4879D